MIVFFDYGAFYEQVSKLVSPVIAFSGKMLHLLLSIPVPCMYILYLYGEHTCSMRNSLPIVNVSRLLKVFESLGLSEYR